MGKIKNYTEAVKELETILAALQSDEIAIDQLEEKVKRANELLEYCQNLLRKAEDAITDR